MNSSRCGGIEPQGRLDNTAVLVGGDGALRCPRRVQRRKGTLNRRTITNAPPARGRRGAACPPLAALSKSVLEPLRLPNCLTALLVVGLLPAAIQAQTTNQATNAPARTRRAMPEPANPNLPS